MLCDTFQQLAKDTWNRIALSRSVQFQLKEETFTDLNMLELKLRHPAQVRTKVFNKLEEGVHGADWEWWFHHPPMDWIGFRVQAKVINLVSGPVQYASLCQPWQRHSTE